MNQKAEMNRLGALGVGKACDARLLFLLQAISDLKCISLSSISFFLLLLYLNLSISVVKKCCANTSFTSFKRWGPSVGFLASLNAMARSSPRFEIGDRRLI